eukprot:5286831-Pyramimonas_sp.AAC.1
MRYGRKRRIAGNRRPGPSRPGGLPEALETRRASRLPGRRSLGAAKRQKTPTTNTPYKIKV